MSTQTLAQALLEDIQADKRVKCFPVTRATQASAHW